MAKMGRPRKEFNKKAFEDLIGLGCSQEEIAWYFRDEKGKTANIDTITRWCKRTYGCTFQEYYKKNGGMAMKISLRRNQFKLSEKSAAMAIFLGKQYLGQSDKVEADVEVESLGFLADLLKDDDSDTEDTLEEILDQT